MVDRDAMNKKIILLILFALSSLACTLTNALPRPGNTPKPTEANTLSPYPTGTSTTAAQVCTVTAEHLNLRSGPGLTWGSIAILNNGETVTILSEPTQGSNWINVHAGGLNGWINSHYCKGK